MWNEKRLDGRNRMEFWSDMKVSGRSQKIQQFAIYPFPNGTPGMDRDVPYGSNLCRYPRANNSNEASRSAMRKDFLDVPEEGATLILAATSP
jgi:hypothetical protein